MKNFNLNRFGLVLKYDVTSNWRAYTFFFVGALIVHFMAQLANVYFSCRGNTSLSEVRESGVVSDAALFYFVCTIFIMPIGLSLAFCNIKTKAQSIAYFMLPASNLEKFVSRLLLFTLGVVVVNNVAFVAADLLRMLALLPMSVHIKSVVLETYSHVPEILVNGATYFWNSKESDVGLWLYAFLNLTSFLFYYLIYLLGAVLFRRWVFIKTSGCILCANLLLSMVLFSFGLYIDSVITLCMACSPFLCAALVYVCYVLFTRKQIVSQSFIRNLFNR